MLKKMNNKGNTLGIVLIGIFILSILGTLILGVTSTNFRMKLSDKKSSMTFYNAEKAMDELYSNLGSDVMDAVTTCYSSALVSYKANRNAYRTADPTSTEDAADMAFREGLRNKLTLLYQDGIVCAAADPALPGLSTSTERLMARLNSYLPTSADYQFVAEAPVGGSIVVEYYKADGTAATNRQDVENIKIKNVKVRCTSNQTGYVSSIVSDFEIKVPDIHLDFTDTPMGDGMDDLSKYALLAEGFQLHPSVVSNITSRTTSAVTINGGSNVTITGNVYAGGSIYNAESQMEGSTQYYKSLGLNPLQKNPSVSVGGNSSLDVNSKVFYCKNDFILNSNSTAYLGNQEATDTTDALDSLQFYADNIKTSATSDSARLYFLGGNCLIHDDLEINGENSSIYIGGNYIGYGLRDVGTPDSSKPLKRVYANGIEDNTVGADYVAAHGVDAVSDEHNKSSAIIINGKGAYVNMAGASGIATPAGTRSIPALKKLILLGRAYIDLDPAGTNYTYMTGESISFKGNQNVYLASVNRDTELRGSKVTTNPMAGSALLSATGKSNLSDVSLTDLEINPDRIITKSIRNNPIAPSGTVYFYTKQLNPEAQTRAFQGIFTSADSVDREKKNDLITQLGATNLDVKIFQLPSRGLNYYTLGTIMNVGRRGANAEITNPIYGRNAAMAPLDAVDGSGNKSNLINFVETIDNRSDNIERNLKDLSEESILLENISDVGSINEETVPDDFYNSIPSPYEFYIDRKKVLNLVGTGKQVIELTLTETTTDNDTIYGCSPSEALSLNQKLCSILKDCGVLRDDMSNAATLKVGIVICNDTAGATALDSVNLDAGLVISEKSSDISKNFTGLIMNHDSVVIRGASTKLTANRELVEFLFANVRDVRNLLSSNVNITPPVTSGFVVGDGSDIKLSYTDLVTKSNWRRDYN